MLSCFTAVQIVGDQSTAINSILGNCKGQSSLAYNLQGQAIREENFSGVYIKAGKKYLK